MAHNKKPIIQIIIEWVALALLGIVLLGNFLSAMDNAAVIFTFKVSLICSLILVVLLLALFLLIKARKVKWQYKDGAVVNIISINKRITIPLLGIIILIWIPPIVKKFGGHSETAQVEESFDKSDTTELKILLLPFRPDIKSKEIDIDYKEQLLERLATLKEKQNLKIKILDLKKYLTPRTESEAIKIGSDKNADMVIWGSYEENETVGKFNRLRLRYVLVSNFEIDNSKKFGDTEMQELNNLSQLRHGYLQENIEYVLFWIQGMYYYKLADFKKSIIYFNEIIKIPQYYTDIESYFRVSDILTGLGENKKALEMTNTYYEQLLKGSPVDSLMVSKAMCKLGSLYSQSGDFKKSFSLFETGIRIQRTEQPICKTCLGSSLYGYAMAYGLSGDFTKAEKLVNESLQILKEEGQEIDLCNNYNLLADIYLGEKKYTEAISTVNKSLELYNKYYPKDYFSKGIIFGTLSLTYYYKGDTALSWKYVDSSLEILENKLPSNHPSLATVYNTKGLLLADKDNYDDAIKLYKKALNISISNLGQYNMEVGGEFNNIALSYLQNEEYDSAEVYFYKGLEVLDKAFEKGSIYHAILYDNLACVYLDKNSFKQAIEYSEKSISMAKAKGSPQLGDFYLKLAQIYREKGGSREKGLENVELAIKFYTGKKDFKPDLDRAMKVKNQLLKSK